MRLRFTPYDRSGAVVVFEGDQVEANVSSSRYAHLLLQFGVAHERLRTAGGRSRKRSQFAKLIAVMLSEGVIALREETF